MKAKLALLFLVSFVCNAQKLLTITEAEQLMQKNNLLLLAEQYNIEASKAAEIQAKIWEQPYFSTELNAINPQNNKYFDIGNNGQKGFAIQQIIYLGGKKRNEVAFAKSNTGIAELQFEQLLRNLKFQLAQTFFSIYYDKQKIATLENQISIVDTLLTNYATQANNGNIPLKTVVRLQSLILNLKNERNELLTDLIESEQNLSLLTGISEIIIPSVNETQIIEKFKNTSITKDSILVLSLANNLDYLTAIKISESAELYYKWQKSIANPDITLGATYDQRGGAFQNQINLTLGIPLAIWNKNKGNIKMADAQLKQININKEYKKMELISSVETLWAIWIQQEMQLKSINNSVSENLTLVYDGMVHNFQKRNISMLEFTDFMESYNQTSIQINEIKKSWILSSISLNNITNKEIFKL